MRRLAGPALAALLSAAGLDAFADDAPPPDPALAAAVANPARSPRLVERDGVRHPADVLAFYGLTPRATVVELWPTGGYWTEILAPYLRDRGKLYDAIEYEPPDSPEHDAAFKRDSYFTHRIAEDPNLFAGATLTAFGPTHEDMAPTGTADVVLGFRVFHVWMKLGFAEEGLVGAYQALKPGGVLALEDHRGNRTVEQDPKAADGYVSQQYVIGLAELAGFKFVGASEIEANPKDTANWPRGVYTLAPIFALGDQDRGTYAAIGEPDDFVLTFRKPD